MKLNWLLVGVSLLGVCVQSMAGGADASNPTAAVKYVDLRQQSYDLGDLGVGDDRDISVIEGAHVFSPEHKVTYELKYWETDVTGNDESGMEMFKIKYTNLTPGELGGVQYKLAIGVEWIQDFGEVRDGIGIGADQIAPLIGAGWILNEKDFVITLAQYFHSYDESRAAGKVRTLNPRLIWIHKLPNNAWIKFDNKFSMDHENGDSSSNILEIQYGRMLTPSIGLYVDYFTNTGGYQQYDDGIGIGLRFMY